jgi:septal ring factor EnvC (AmiA/AmiB activator)
LTETKFQPPQPPSAEPIIVTLDPDDKPDVNLEQKYHLMKKKLKKQKDITETQQGEIEDLRAQLEELQKETFAKIKQSHDQSERRMRELENTLSKAYTNLRNLDKQNHELTEMKLDLEEEIRKRDAKVIVCSAKRIF